MTKVDMGTVEELSNAIKENCAKNVENISSSNTDNANIFEEARSIILKNTQLKSPSCNVLMTTEELEQLQLSLLQKAQELTCVENVHNMDNGHAIDENTIPMESENETEHQALVASVDDERDFFEGEVIELARVLWKSTAEQQNFTKGCLWSPDGTCLLVPVNLDGMHMYELPSDLYSATHINVDRPLTNLKPAFCVAEGGTVYDVSWYPFMNSQDPNTCCWLATRQHEPIHLWDAFDGSLRCSYRGYDAVDEVETAISVIFSLDAQQVIGGYKKSIKIFDTSVPGRDCNTFAVKQAVSCFAQNDLSSITAGSWKGFINHYDLRIPKNPQLVLGGHSGGITWLRYAKTDDTETHAYMLFSGARKDGRLLQWDLRNTLEPVREFQRNVTTNQRIYFDLSPQENWLISGDTQGALHVWNLMDQSKSYKLPIHKDCCNGVSVNSTRPLLATSSGQYHFTEMHTNDTEMPLKLADCNDKTEEKIVQYENALCLLWRGKTTATTTTISE